MKTYVAMDVFIYAFLFSALDGKQINKKQGRKERERENE
jgi:hypothetical protein